MLDSLWQLLGAAALGVIGVLGGKLWLSNRKAKDLEQREQQRDEAERRHLAAAQSRVMEVRRNAANQAPIDAKSRKDFE